MLTTVYNTHQKLPEPMTAKSSVGTGFPEPTGLPAQQHGSVGAPKSCRTVAAPLLFIALVETNITSGSNLHAALACKALQRSLAQGVQPASIDALQPATSCVETWWHLQDHRKMVIDSR